jgi:hypothetical protein
MNSEEDTWDYYQNKYRPLANALNKQLMSLSDVARSLIGSQDVAPAAGRESLATFALRRHGLNVLCTVHDASLPSEAV